MKPGWEGRPLVSLSSGLGGTVGLAVVAWLLYLAVKVAQHVEAWPF